MGVETMSNHGISGARVRRQDAMESSLENYGTDCRDEARAVGDCGPPGGWRDGRLEYRVAGQFLHHLGLCLMRRVSGEAAQQEISLSIRPRNSKVCCPGSRTPVAAGRTQEANYCQPEGQLRLNGKEFTPRLH